ncbi:uncharacterized protein BKA78DRAFT_49303 [Phyllosticta capitalensis]|uniref:uncharacterized protein n=1 Tax=Phyllosticta capitalensis TaxID=121624 RepID=UPI003130D1A4
MSQQQQQPPTSAAYAQPSNPVERNPAESASTSSTTASANAPTTAHRTAPSASSGGDDGVPSALGRGVHGTSADADVEERKPGQQKQRDDVDADEQMAPPGEGAVADAVMAGGQGGGKTGAQGAGGGLSMESDLERKKAEQAPLREAVKEERARGVDVDGALGQTGGHAT